MKNIIKKALRQLGLEVRHLAKTPPVIKEGSTERPIGNVRMFLEDIRERGFRPKGIIDVGANQGNWTRMALAVFPNAKVTMIEPQKEMCESLIKLCSENQAVNFIQAGAGRKKGELIQTIWEDLAGSSFIIEPNDEMLRKGRQRITQMVTIDDVVKDRKDFTPDLVKLDIQGFELEALNGATSLFGKTQLFILETSLYHFHPKVPVAADCIQFMGDNGYELYDITEYLRRPLDGALGQIDLAFALREGDLRRSDAWSS